MKTYARFILIFTLCGLLISACQPANLPAASPTQPPPTSTPLPPTATATPAPTNTPEPTPTVPSPTPTGPINPLTGLPAEDPTLLERRPVLVKIENLPRASRPQFGLSLADLVFEYHTEEGTTRFAALFYGSNAEKVGPVRSGRVFDIELVEMYRSLFVFGGAYPTVLSRIYNQLPVNNLIVEDPRFAPALYRDNSNQAYYLMLDMNALDEVLQKNSIDNAKQDLVDMAFQQEPPAGGQPADQVYVRYSGAIYNRWDYDPQSGEYLRFVDQANAFNIADETYTQLTDQLTGQPISAENVVMVVVKNVQIERNIYEIQLFDSGPAYIARDGQIYEVRWMRGDDDDILVLQDLQGNPFPFKPGQTWFEILSDPITSEHEEDAWRFIYHFPD